MDVQSCAKTLQDVIDTHCKPVIINNDQGSKFTSEVFTNTILSNDIKLIMDGKERAIDNVFIERLWCKPIQTPNPILWLL
ncbi:hypothetical protein OAC51_09285 [Flavobacteriaceae bacterium]|nr:hypothetical protein [Flavobacteriaceae bacterium]